MSRLVRVVIAVLACLPPFFSAGAHGDTCGETSRNLSPGPGWHNYVDCRQCTTGSNPGGYTVDNMVVYTEGGGGTADIRPAIYCREAGGCSGGYSDDDLICESETLNISSSESWKTLSISGCGTRGANEDIWICTNINASSLEYGMDTSCSTGGTDDYYRVWTYGASPDPLGSTSSGQCDVSRYINITEASASDRRVIHVGDSRGPSITCGDDEYYASE